MYFIGPSVLTDLTHEGILLRAASVHPFVAVLHNACLGRAVRLIRFPVEVGEQVTCVNTRLY